MFGIEKKYDEEADKLLRKKMKEIYGKVNERKEFDSGYIYNDKDEFRLLVDMGKKAGSSNDETIRMMAELKKDIKITLKRRFKPVRTTEEEMFYNSLANDYRKIHRREKAKEAKLYDDVTDRYYSYNEEYTDRVAEFGKLNSNDKDIITLMDIFGQQVRKYGNIVDNAKIELKEAEKNPDFSNVKFEEMHQPGDGGKVSVSGNFYCLIDEQNSIYKTFDERQFVSGDFYNIHDRMEASRDYSLKIKKLEGKSLDESIAILNIVDVKKINKDMGVVSISQGRSL